MHTASKKQLIIKNHENNWIKESEKKQDQSQFSFSSPQENDNVTS